MVDTYPIGSRNYLGRAERRLSDDSYDSMFYAAFELRCGIEARMQEYMEAWSHISEKKKRGWRISRLGKDIESAFKIGNMIVRWQILDVQSHMPIACLYHTPVTRELQDKGGQLGNYLHALKQRRHIDDPWWFEFRTLLLEVSKDLRIANLGTLLGPPMWREGSSQMQMNMEIPPGSNIGQIISEMGGSKLTVKIEYLEALPDPLEPEAVVWAR